MCWNLAWSRPNQTHMACVGDTTTLNTGQAVFILKEGKPTIWLACESFQ
jgi:hypothetical protein